MLNFAYFFVEFSVARSIGSVALFADSIDFLEDAAINTLILFALGWAPRRRADVGTLLAFILLVPGLFTLATAWQKFAAPVAPDATLLSFTGAGALVVNVYCAFSLARFRAHSGSLSRAAFLSARNDALSNIAIMIAGLITTLAASPWPDWIVGLGIFLLNADAARQVYRAAKAER